MYCVYLTVYRGNKLPKRYIGSTTIKRISEGYNGSIKSKKYKAIFKDEQLTNKKAFKTRILSRHTTHREAIIEELRLQIKFNVVKSEKYMNMSLACPNGCFGRNLSGHNHPMYGKKHTKEARAKISASVKDQFKNGKKSPFSFMDLSGLNNPFYGKRHSEESKQKMRKPKKFVPKFTCPHCEKQYDAGNLKQHMLRHGYSEYDVAVIKNNILSNQKDGKLHLMLITSD